MVKSFKSILIREKKRLKLNNEFINKKTKAFQI